MIKRGNICKEIESERFFIIHSIGMLKTDSHYIQTINYKALDTKHKKYSINDIVYTTIFSEFPNQSQCTFLWPVGPI